MVTGSSSTDGALTLNTILHMLTIKLSSINYLLWKNQITPLLRHQHLLDHVDGTTEAPAPEVMLEGKSSPNPLYSV